MTNRYLALMTGLLTISLTLPAQASKKADEEQGAPRSKVPAAVPATRGKTAAEIRQERLERMQERAREQREISSLNAEMANFKAHMLKDELETTATTNKIIKDSLIVLKDQIIALKDNYNYKGSDAQLRQYAGLIKATLANMERTVDSYSKFLTEKPLGNGKVYSDRLSGYTKNLMQYRQEYDKRISAEMEGDWVVMN